MAHNETHLWTFTPILHSNWAGPVTCFNRQNALEVMLWNFRGWALRSFAASTCFHHGTLHFGLRYHSRMNEAQATTWRSLHEQEPRPRSISSTERPANSLSLTCHLCECGYFGPPSHPPNGAELSTHLSEWYKIVVSSLKVWGRYYTMRDSWKDRRNLLPVRLEGDSVIAREFT